MIRSEHSSMIFDISTASVPSRASRESFLSIA